MTAPELVVPAHLCGVVGKRVEPEQPVAARALLVPQHLLLAVKNRAGQYRAGYKSSESEHPLLLGPKRLPPVTDPSAGNFKGSKKNDEGATGRDRSSSGRHPQTPAQARRHATRS